jgi:hypothetical protein
MPLCKRCLLRGASPQAKRAAFRATKQGHLSDAEVEEELARSAAAVARAVEFAAASPSVAGLEEGERDLYVRAVLELVAKYSGFLAKSRELSAPAASVALLYYQHALSAGSKEAVEAGCEALRALVSRDPAAYASDSSLSVLSSVYSATPATVDPEAREGLASCVCRVLAQLPEPRCGELVASLAGAHIERARSPPLSPATAAPELRMLAVIFRSLKIPAANTTLADNATSVCAPLLTAVWPTVVELVKAHAESEELQGALAEVFREAVQMPAADPAATLRELVAVWHLGKGRDVGLW